MRVFEARKKLRNKKIEFVDNYQRCGVFQLVKETLTKGKRTKILLLARHKSINQPRSSLTDLEKNEGSGRRMDTEAVFNSNNKNDLNNRQPEFFNQQSKKYRTSCHLSINAVYCSNISVSNGFLNEIRAENSNFFFSIFNLIVYADYILITLKDVEKQLKNNFVADK